MEREYLCLGMGFAPRNLGEVEKILTRTSWDELWTRSEEELINGVKLNKYIYITKNDGDFFIGIMLSKEQNSPMASINYEYGKNYIDEFWEYVRKCKDVLDIGELIVKRTYTPIMKLVVIKEDDGCNDC